MSSPFDIVVVPDFGGNAGRVFEARTLFFLASWIENSGASKHFPLHLACIGQPPSSVSSLAGECGATITIHEPLKASAKQSINKLRGLETAGKTANVLLLDADVLILSDLGGLTESVHSFSVSAAPGEIPRIPDRQWQTIYSALGMDLPSERMQAIEVELGIDRFGPAAHARANRMLPYYNSGITFLPWSLAADLRELWRLHFSVISDIFLQAKDPEWPKLTDEAALSTAFEQLKLRGIPFERLPGRYHTGWRHVYARAIRLDESAIFHMTTSFRDLGSENSYIRAIRLYQANLLNRFARVWFRSGNVVSKVADAHVRLLPAVVDLFKLGQILTSLYKRHVLPALQAGHGACNAPR